MCPFLWLTFEYVVYGVGVFSVTLPHATIYVNCTPIMTGPAVAVMVAIYAYRLLRG